MHKKLGALPNIFTTFALSPAALNGYVQLGECLAGGRLTARQREQVALAVAQENACQYCLSAHAAIGQGAGLSDADLAAVRQGGFDDDLVVEIIANVALNVMTNYLNKVAGTEIDFPVVTAERIAEPA